MVRAKSSPGSVPSGGVPSGSPGRPAGNPKSADGGRRDTIPAPGVDLTQSGMQGTSTYYVGGPNGNRADKGSPSSEPDPNVVNTGYAPNVGAGPQPSECVSDDRLYGIADPMLPAVEGDPAPVVPTFGTGSSGD